MNNEWCVRVKSRTKTKQTLTEMSAKKNYLTMSKSAMRHSFYARKKNCVEGQGSRDTACECVFFYEMHLKLDILTSADVQKRSYVC